MKVILLRDVAKLGKRFSIVEVPDGYAQNKLIPQGIVMAATPENQKRIASVTSKQEAAKEMEVGDIKASLAALKEKKVELTVDANAQDHLFKAVKSSDIAQALVSMGYALPVDALKLSDPIKALGEYIVPVEFNGVKGEVVVLINRK